MHFLRARQLLLSSSLASAMTFLKDLQLVSRVLQRYVMFAPQLKPLHRQLASLVQRQHLDSGMTLQKLLHRWLFLQNYVVHPLEQ